MRPVTQTRFGRPCGNCFAASIASILELELEAVDWSADMTAEEIEPDGPTGDASPEWHRRRLERVYALGYWLYEHEAEHVATWRVEAIPAGAHVLLYGPNPDGVSHVVVGVSRPRAGRLEIAQAWDPNPGRRGITAVRHVGLLVRR